MIYVLIAGLVVFTVSIPFFIRNRELLEERGFQVKQILINCIMGIVLLVILLIVLTR